ncbi:hypothetical protein CC2G_008561 [Coprinopsis cinerea AmutBmut pab1-1]|nr:hypothetical protein CC2G_008561 [Coprinopsis cinerea AmutBmut pab1-1]
MPYFEGGRHYTFSNCTFNDVGHNQINTDNSTTTQMTGSGNRSTWSNVQSSSVQNTPTQSHPGARQSFNGDDPAYLYQRPFIATPSPFVNQTMQPPWAWHPMTMTFMPYLWYHTTNPSKAPNLLLFNNLLRFIRTLDSFHRATLRSTKTLHTFRADAQIARSLAPVVTTLSIMANQLRIQMSGSQETREDTFESWRGQYGVEEETDEVLSERRWPRVGPHPNAINIALSIALWYG